jgi:VanZ family protein
VLDQPVFTPNPRSGFRQFVFYWLPVLVYLTAIFYFSSLSNPPSPLHFDNADKLEHLCEYGLFGLLVGRAIRRSVSPYSMLAAAVITVSLVMMIAAADEYFQSFVPGRDSDIFDWLTDTTAAVASQLVLWRFWSAAETQRKRARAAAAAGRGGA